MAIDFNIIGKRIKDARRKKNLTQEQLVEKLGVSIAYLSKVETGKIHINLERLSQICELLDITEGEILNGVSNNSDNYLIPEFNEILSKCSKNAIKWLWSLGKSI